MAYPHKWRNPNNHLILSYECKFKESLDQEFKTTKPSSALVHFEIKFIPKETLFLNHIKLSCLLYHPNQILDVWT